jgi:hypothetical protein
VGRRRVAAESAVADCAGAGGATAVLAWKGAAIARRERTRFTLSVARRKWCELLGALRILCDSFR